MTGIAMPIDLEREKMPIPKKRALELAKQALEEGGDFPPGFTYDLASYSVPDLDMDEIIGLREEHFKRLGRKPPKLEVFE